MTELRDAAGRPKRWLRSAATVCAFAYPLLLLLIVLLLRLVGERWWVTTVALYVPRGDLGVPGPLIVLALLFQRRFWLLGTQVVAAGILIFPLMGLVLPPFHAAPGAGPTVRVLSLNADSANEGTNMLLAALDRYAPDIVLLQEISVTPGQPFYRALRARYGTVYGSSQFVIASRFPLTPTRDSDLPWSSPARRPARFARYVVDTPIGAIALYNVHFISPREAFYKARSGLRGDILSGRLFVGAGGGPIPTNSRLRSLQVDDVAALAKTETIPVLIAGDTNLPGQSPLLARLADGYRDGFQEAGAGFGYTFPANGAWMRIDRMLASERLRFLHFEVGCTGASDHLCVLGELASHGYSGKPAASL